MNVQKQLFLRLMTELLPPAVRRESIRGYLHFDDQTSCLKMARPGMGDLVTGKSGFLAGLSLLGAGLIILI
jgi:hypothetical protein